MSSDSGESHTSAHDDNGDNTGAGSASRDSPIDARDTEDLGAPANNVAQEEDQQELESLDSGANGLTFATHRKAQRDEDYGESTPELAIRPAFRRAGSVESTSTPDDTPSIQVG